MSDYNFLEIEKKCRKLAEEKIGVATNREKPKYFIIGHT
jgi:hypothetical protein